MLSAQYFARKCICRTKKHSKCDVTVCCGCERRHMSADRTYLEYIYPRANGAKRRARVLTPHGYLHPGKGKHCEVWSSSNIAGAWFKGGGEWVVITDLKNMADYIALQYFVFLQNDLATFTTNEGWSFLISGIWRTIRSSKHLRHPKRREIRRKRLPQDSWREINSGKIQRSAKNWLWRETQGKFVDNAYLYLCFNAL